MRGTLFLLTILLVTPALAYCQNEPSRATENSYRQSAPQESNSTLTGCLTGKPDEYQVTDQEGTTHLLFSPTVNLSSHVGQSVTLQGEQDVRRDASASSDEGTAHGMHFFRVLAVTQTSGACK
jgi:hypothetical protein